MPKKKSSKANADANAAKERSNGSTVFEASGVASHEINETILRLFACRMGMGTSKNGPDSRNEANRVIALGDDDEENRENFNKLSKLLESRSFNLECDAEQKADIKCLLKTFDDKMALSPKRCLKECVSDFCRCDNCRKKLEQKTKEAEKEAEKNACCLIEEEERKKEKTEKKKMQKKKSKRKSKQKKAEEEKKHVEDTEKLEEQMKDLEGERSKKVDKEEEIAEVSKKKQKTKKAKKSEKSKGTNSRWDTEKPSTPTSLPQSSSDEEELNLNSAFVADIAQRKSKASAIANRNMFVETQYTIDLYDSADSEEVSDSQESFMSESNFKQNHSFHKESVDQNKNVLMEDKSKSNDRFRGVERDEKVVKSLDIGAQANKEALNKNFHSSIELFNTAIELNPKDYRFYVNRSYCYDCINDYESALKDAETAITLNHTWPKCYYRKGRALTGLKRFEEAEVAFNKVLELEEDECKEAKSELMKVREEAVRQLGYDKNIAIMAAKKYNSVKEAIYSVVNCLVNIGRQTDDECDSEDELILNANLNYPKLAEKESYDVTNPFGWKALWIGNLSGTAEQETLQQMFCKFGVLSHCGLYKRAEGAFALVHYDNAESPRRAMASYQGTVIKGLSLNDTEKLIIRFRPNRDQKKDKYQERLDIEECYYWRTTGCLRADICQYLHIPANKGVDIQPWMKTPESKSRIGLNSRPQSMKK